MLKLRGPFGSNHQMRHGKATMSWWKGLEVPWPVLRTWPALMSVRLGWFKVLKFFQTNPQVLFHLRHSDMLQGAIDKQTQKKE